MMKILTALGAVCLAALAYWLVFAGSGELSVKNAYARSSGMAGSAYFEVHNGTRTPDRILSVETAVASMTELHTNIETADGVMQMRPLEDTVIPPRSVVKFERGGKHVMLMGVTNGFADGKTIEMTIVFEHAGPIIVQIPVDNAR